jgi:transposase-like protein
VDVLTEYSNFPGLLVDLTEISRKLDACKQQLDTVRRSVRSERDQTPCTWSLQDRLPAGTLDTIVTSYQAGTSARALAERFNISKSSVKRVLRERGVRRAK